MARLIAGRLEVWKASPGKRAMFGLGTHWIFSMDRADIQIKPEVSPKPPKLPNSPFTQQHHQATAMARGPHRLLPPARIGNRALRKGDGPADCWKFGSLEGFTWEAGDVRAWDSLDFFHGEDGDPDRARGLSNDFQTSKLPVHPAALSSHRNGPRSPPVVAPSPDWKIEIALPEGYFAGLGVGAAMPVGAGALPPIRPETPPETMKVMTSELLASSNSTRLRGTMMTLPAKL
jgi:hypothetical protein